MQELTLNTDFNGIVLFDPATLSSFYGRKIEEGEDLFTRFTTTDEGDQVLAAGAVLPILAIDDAGYDILVRLHNETSKIDNSDIVNTNGDFALSVRGQLYIADLAVIKEWEEYTDWQKLNIPKGEYSVAVNGFVRKDAEGNIEKAGYEFVLNPVCVLLKPTANLSKNMRVLA